MKYKDINVRKYQVIKHIINKYAETHDNVTPNVSYDKDSKILDVSGISRPINFNTESIGIVPKGAYEVVGQVIRSRTDDGHVDRDGMNVYDSVQRIFNIANDNRQEVFDFITENSRSSYCACCGTNRDRNKLFYIRRVDMSGKMYQVGSRCITEYFDTSYFDLMKDISNVIEHQGKISSRQFADYNLIDYLALYCLFIKTTDNMKACSQKIIEILDSCEDVSETKWASEFLVQKATNFDKISAIAKFYSAYPNYAREDNMFAIKTVQSMADMLSDNLDVDPYYSKSNCLNVAKMYISLLHDYANDLRRYTKDLFKYNAYMVETNLSGLWEEHNHTAYKLNFALNDHVFNISIINAMPPVPKNIKIVVPLDNEGNMVDKTKAETALIALASKLNKLQTIKSQKSIVVDTLSKYRDVCLQRYRNYKPTITFKGSESTVTFFDYTDDPLVIKVVDDIEQSKVSLAAFINRAYTRQKLTAAYKEFSKKYTGTAAMAYTQSKELNLQFSCVYAEAQLNANLPQGTSLWKLDSYVDAANKNVVLQCNRSSLKMPVNSIGIISGADNDITMRIQTLLSEELGLPSPRVKKVREPKTAEDIVKSRPKKNVTRLFNSLGASAKNLVSMKKVNIANDTSSTALGVSVKDIGRILFNTENGEVATRNGNYRGKINLDGHNISYNKEFDKDTFINAVHALEYLVYLSDENNKLLCSREVTSVKKGTNYTYRYDVRCGNCKGYLQFRMFHDGEKCILRYAPKFVVEQLVDGNQLTCVLNINFSEECWKDIQNGILKLNDLQQNGSVLHGQKNNNMISGTVWMSNHEPQRLTNEMFTKLTGINI